MLSLLIATFINCHHHCSHHRCKTLHCCWLCCHWLLPLHPSRFLVCCSDHFHHFYLHCNSCCCCYNHCHMMLSSLPHSDCFGCYFACLYCCQLIHTCCIFQCHCHCWFLVQLHLIHRILPSLVSVMATVPWSAKDSCKMVALWCCCCCFVVYHHAAATQPCCLHSTVAPLLRDPCHVAIVDVDNHFDNCRHCWILSQTAT